MGLGFVEILRKGYVVYKDRIKALTLLTVITFVLLLLKKASEIFVLTYALFLIPSVSTIMIQCFLWIVNAIFLPCVLFPIFLMITICIHDKERGIIGTLTSRWKVITKSAIIFTVVLLVLMITIDTLHYLMIPQWFYEQDIAIHRMHKYSHSIVSSNITGQEETTFQLQSLFNQTMSELNEIDARYSKELITLSIIAAIIHFCAFIVFFNVPYCLLCTDCVVKHAKTKKETSMLSRVRKGVSLVKYNLLNIVLLVIIILVFLIPVTLVSIIFISLIGMLWYIVVLTITVLIIFPYLLSLYVPIVEDGITKASEKQRSGKENKRRKR